MRRCLILIFIVINASVLRGQDLQTNAGFLLKAQIKLGNQNQGFKVGAYGIANVRYNEIALESGAALFSGYLFKRHKTKTKDIHFGYDVFALMGIGKNDNLLASSFFMDTPLVYDPEKDQKFYGVGFGFEKEFLPENLKEFDQRLSKFLLRFSNANHSINIQFKNDFRFGKLMNGEGTDFGNTGILLVSLSRYSNPVEAYHVGLGLHLFTPEANYGLTPDNPQNSDDGSRNVWYTKGNHPKLFYANLYGFGRYQNEGVYAFAKAGINSQKLGAYIQNTLHDSFGLNPRYPWNVSAADELFIEISGGAFLPERND